MREARAAVLQTALLAGLALALLLGTHHGAPLLRVSAIAGLVVLAGHVLARLGSAPRPPRPVITRPPPAVTVDTGRVALEWSLESAVHADRVLRPRLARLADDRLQHRYGVELRRRPERARQLLGDRLTAALTPAAPGRAASDPPTRAALSALLSTLEQL